MLRRSPRDDDARLGGSGASGFHDEAPAMRCTALLSASFRRGGVAYKRMGVGASCLEAQSEGGAYPP